MSRLPYGLGWANMMGTDQRPPSIWADGVEPSEYTPEPKDQNWRKEYDEAWKDEPGKPAPAWKKEYDEAWSNEPEKGPEGGNSYQWPWNQAQPPGGALRPRNLMGEADQPTGITPIVAQQPWTKAKDLHLSRLQQAHADIDNQLASATITEAEHQDLMGQISKQMQPLLQARQQQEQQAKQQAQMEEMQARAFQTSASLQDRSMWAKGFPQTVAETVDAMTGAVTKFFQQPDGSFEQIQVASAGGRDDGTMTDAPGQMVPDGPQSPAEGEQTVSFAVDPADDQPSDQGVEDETQYSKMVDDALAKYGDWKNMPPEVYSKIQQRLIELNEKRSKLGVNLYSAEAPAEGRQPEGGTLPGGFPPDATTPPEAAPAPVVGGASQQRINPLTGKPSSGRVMSLGTPEYGTKAHFKQVQAAGKFQQLVQSGMPPQMAQFAAYNPKGFERMQLASQLAQQGASEEVQDAAFGGMITSGEIKELQKRATQAAGPPPRRTGDPRLDRANFMEWQKTKNDLFQSFAGSFMRGKEAEKGRGFKQTEAEKVREHKEVMLQKKTDAAILIKDHAFENAKELNDYITANGIGRDEANHLRRLQIIAEKQRNEQKAEKQRDHILSSRSQAIKELKAMGVENPSDEQIDKRAAGIRGAIEQEQKRLAEKDKPKMVQIGPIQNQTIDGVPIEEYRKQQAAQVPPLPKEGFKTVDDLSSHLNDLKTKGIPFENLPPEQKKAILDARERLGGK